MHSINYLVSLVFIHLNVNDRLLIKSYHLCSSFCMSSGIERMELDKMVTRVFLKALSPDPILANLKYLKIDVSAEESYIREAVKILFNQLFKSKHQKVEFQLHWYSNMYIQSVNIFSHFCLISSHLFGLIHIKIAHNFPIYSHRVKRKRLKHIGKKKLGIVLPSWMYARRVLIRFEVTNLS